MVPAGLGQSRMQLTLHGTWRMDFQRGITIYRIQVFWSRTTSLALSRKGFNARKSGRRVNACGIGSVVKELDVALG